MGEGRGTPAFRSPVGDPRQAALHAPHKVPLGSPLALAPPSSPHVPRLSPRLHLLFLLIGDLDGCLPGSRGTHFASGFLVLGSESDF